MSTRILSAILLTAAVAGRVDPSARPPTPAPEVAPGIREIVASARAQTRVTTSYDPSYVGITFPGGDVPARTGACADVVVRAFRAAGIDLQRDVHMDMLRAFSAYPHRWGLRRPDPNIDHRRVPNLMVYFRRAGKAVAVTTQPRDYWSGDVGAWDLGGGVMHSGLVSDAADSATGRHWVVHNIGAGARLEDVLFRWRVIGHYRYFRSCVPPRRRR